MPEKKPLSPAPTHNLTVDDLIGRQSVRATFKLPQEIINLHSLMAGQLGIKKKSLFDQLIGNTAILRQIAKEAKKQQMHSGKRRQKTFVLSRSSLSSLNTVSAEEEVSRDLLVELSIQRLLPVYAAEIEKHGKRKEILKEMTAYLRRGDALLKKSAQLLGRDDQLYLLLKEQLSTARKNLALVDKMVQRGKVMEDDDFGNSAHF